MRVAERESQGDRPWQRGEREASPPLANAAESGGIEGGGATPRQRPTPSRRRPRRALTPRPHESPCPPGCGSDSTA